MRFIIGKPGEEKSDKVNVWLEDAGHAVRLYIQREGWEKETLLSFSPYHICVFDDLLDKREIQGLRPYCPRGSE